MVQQKRGGVERLYLFDKQSGYSEGINEYGISIVSAAVSVKTDEKEGSKSNSTAPDSPDGKRIRSALLQKTVAGAVRSLIESKIPGNTFVTDGKTCVLIESGYARDDDERTNYLMKKVQCNKNTVYVRTNHGITIPTGYSSKIEGEEAKRKSSEKRRSYALKAAEKAKDPQELLNALGITPDKDPQMNPIRLVKNHHHDALTTGQLLIVPDHKTMTYRPTLSEIELDNYNKINGVKSNTYFEIISNRQLTTYKDFFK